MTKKHINKFKEFDKIEPKKPKRTDQNKFIGAVKPTGKQKSSKLQVKSRLTNVWNKANANTELGKKIRAMMYDMSKDKKYVEKNYQREIIKGNAYSKIDIRDGLAFAKKRALNNAKIQYKRLVTIQKKANKITTYAEFRKDNPQFTRSKIDVKKAHKKYQILVNKQKKKNLKKTSFKDFKKANPHLINPLTGFDSADVESFYDS